MKTGRIRIKKQPPRQETPAPPQPASPSAPAQVSHQPAPAQPYAVSKFNPSWILVVLMICLIVTALVGTMLSSRGRADEWILAERADGAWTATVTVFGPQVTTAWRWETDCTNDPNCAILPGTCIMTNTHVFHHTPVREYDEHAYDIYYEETWGQVYEAKDTGFMVTQLAADDWWEGDLHYVRTEELNQESCEYSDYTVWVNDPETATQEIEVYLSECEIWDHVTVTRRTYDRKPWCQANITAIVKIGEQSGQGSGLDVRWPQPAVPPGGRTEQAFGGQVTFRADDQTFTVSTTDLAEYRRYLTSPYYLGFRDGKPVGVSANPPQK